jgi:hypothetical protein
VEAACPPTGRRRSWRCGWRSSSFSPSTASEVPFPAVLPFLVSPFISFLRSGPFTGAMRRIFFCCAVLKGISDGLSRGKRPEEMEKLVSKILPFCSLVSGEISGEETVFSDFDFGYTS